MIFNEKRPPIKNISQIEHTRHKDSSKFSRESPGRFSSIFLPREKTVFEFGK